MRMGHKAFHILCLYMVVPYSCVCQYALFHTISGSSRTGVIVVILVVVLLILGVIVCFGVGGGSYRRSRRRRRIQATPVVTIHPPPTISTATHIPPPQQLPLPATNYSNPTDKDYPPPYSVTPDAPPYPLATSIPPPVQGEWPVAPPNTSTCYPPQ